MKGKQLEEFTKKWSGIALNDDSILIYGQDGTLFKTIEDAVKAGEYHPILKKSTDLLIDDLNGVILEVTKKDDLKPLYQILKNWFGDSGKSLNVGGSLGRLQEAIKELSKDSKRPTIPNDLKKEIYDYYMANQDTTSKNQLAKDLGLAYPTVMNMIKKFES